MFGRKAGEARVLAREAATELTDDELRAIAGGETRLTPCGDNLDDVTHYAASTDCDS